MSSAFSFPSPVSSIPRDLNIGPSRCTRKPSTRFVLHIPIRSAAPPSRPDASKPVDIAKPLDTTPKIPETPCFTPRIMSTPMPTEHRALYLHAAAQATAEYLSSYKPDKSPQVSQLTCLVPELDPEIDVYDRRFLLQLVWSVVDVTAASCGLRTRVLIQGTKAFGAVPLSIAGLRRTFDADLALSKESWPEDAIRAGVLEDPADIDERDEIIVVVSPTNAVSLPIINSLRDMVARANGRPILLLNPRLKDVPSHSGVMQVSGRAERIKFMKGVEDIFYLRLLFDAGTMYPVRGILYRAFPNEWQLWRSENDLSYRFILSSPTRPSTSDITNAFTVDKYAEEKKRLQEAKDDGSMVTLDSLVTIPFVIVIVVAGLAFTWLRLL